LKTAFEENLTKVNKVIDKAFNLVAKLFHKVHLSQRDIFDFIGLFMKAVVITALLFTFVFRTVVVDGPSMENTLQNEDRLIVNQFFYEPHRGDIVVVTKDTKANGPIIKRVIAVAGDMIDIDFINGIVTVNGKELDEPYIKETTRLQRDVKFPQTVEENCVFVMGDNRNNSHDSRALDVGMVELKYVMGKAIFRLSPFDKFGKIE